MFEGGGDEDVLPAMLFGLATPLLLHGKSSNNTNGGIEASSGNATAAPVKDEGAAATAEKADAGGAGEGLYRVVPEGIKPAASYSVCRFVLFQALKAVEAEDA